MIHQILTQLEKNQIQMYDFPEQELDPQQYWMRTLLPFGVVGSNTSIADGEGNMYRGREYPWGVVNIEDQVSLGLGQRIPRSLEYLLLTLLLTITEP